MRTAYALLAAALVAAAAPAAAGSTVRIPFPRSGGELTPLTFRLGYPLVTLVYDTLTWRDGSGVPRPWLARSLRTSPDGRRLTVRLRDGVRWHDGRPLRARDVAFTFDYVRARGHPRFTPQLSALQSVRARGPLTVEFRLRHPSLGFPDQPLADVPILPEHLWSRLAPGAQAPPGLPVGSGPYELAARRPDGGYRLTANPDYFRGRPAVEEVEVPVVRRAADMVAGLRRGRLEALPFTLTPPLEAAVRSLTVTISRGSLYLGTVLLLNARRPPFDRVEVRRAVAAAIDPERVARAAGDSVAATRGVLHPESRWAPDAPVPAASGPRLADLDVPEISVLAPSNDPVRREAGRQVVLALQRAGATARVAEVSRSALGRAVGEGGGTPDFAAAIWSMPALASYDPDFLPALFGPGAPLNRSGYRSPAFDALARRVAAAPTEAERRSAVAAELQRLAGDAPVVPLLFPRGAFAYRPAVHRGWTYIAGSGIVDKRSLLRRGPPAASAAELRGPVPEPPGDGPGLLTILAVAALGVSIALAVAAAVVRRA